MTAAPVDRPHALVFTVRCRPEGTFTFDADPAHTGLVLELTPVDLAGRLTARRLPFADPADAPAFWASVDRSAETLRPWKRDVHVRGERTGRDVWLRASAAPARGPGGAVTWTGAAVDVSDLRAAQARMRDAYHRLSSHLDNTPLAVVKWDSGLRVVRWNAQAERVFGWSAAEVVGKHVLEWRFFHEDDAPAAAALAADLRAGRQTRTVHVGRNYTRSGAVVWCEWHNSIAPDADGRASTILSLGLDVTERKTGREALARSEALLRTALEGARMLGWEWDLATGRRHHSQDAAAFFGLPPGDYSASGQTEAAVHPDDHPAVVEARRRALCGDAPFRYEYRGRPAADGAVRWYVTRGEIEPGPDGRPARVLGVTADVTDRKRAEQERDAATRRLQEAQKLESLGVLAGGVAHDFNNLLTVILGNAGLARRESPPGAAVVGYFDQIDDACRRAADLCRQMLAFAGRGQPAFVPVDVVRTVRESAGLLEAAAAGRARLVYDPAPDAPAARADPTQVRQVLTNLVINAAEATDAAGGEVRVRVAGVTVGADAPPGFDPPPPAGRYTLLRVADRGHGMTADVRARIFDPFFTTKFAGRGLGLAAVLGIVRAHAGSIRVDTAPGQGATFEVLWPAADAPAAVTPPPPPPPVPATGRALVVDDEMFVRELIASTVEELGLVPVLAGDGPSGLEEFEAHRASVRVAVVDVVMPGMGGEQVVERLREQDAALPVVVVSGFTERPAGPWARGPRTTFLQKPFHPEELTAAIQKVMAARV